GALFVALPGERSDGHTFVEHAFGGGAVAALVRRGSVPAVHGSSGALVEVEDVGRALRDLAADERSRSDAIVVGITGSTGKTCTKDFTGALLALRFRTVASRGSFNNEVGLPLTILPAPPDTEVLV